MDTPKADKPVPESTHSSTAESRTQQPANEQLQKGSVHSKHAFRFILTYIALLILVSLIGFGVHWYHDHHSKVTKNNSVQAQKTKPSLAAANPYAGWRQYCDDSNKACYRYPASWTESQHSQTLSGATNLVESQVQSPDKDVNTIYSYPYYKDANNFNFLTMSIENIPNYPNLKVVGGVYLNAPGGGYFVQYVVVDSYLVTEDGLTVGKTSQFINTARFALGGNFSDSTAGTKDIYQFIAIDAQSVGNANYSLTAAKSWFTTQDAKDSLLMLESLSPEEVSTASQYFTIKEWNVRAPYSGSLGLQYVISGTGSASLSSSQLAAGGPDVCAQIENGEAGILSRYLPTDTNLGPGIPATETAAQYVSQNSAVPYALVGNYIYIYWGNNYLTNGEYNGPCSDKTAALQTIEAYSNLLPKLQSTQ